MTGILSLFRKFIDNKLIKIILIYESCNSYLSNKKLLVKKSKWLTGKVIFLKRIFYIKNKFFSIYKI